ncbi:helix-turn-helix transcriptional regulator [Amycolatopsis taiwanensis]|uniref:helix-turn-helix transcriptional regulator n=1 Tax=Amycolatopsis taiwanensis TaxID=342230 RepID=UPI000484E958|nr:helix-turn-helix transcriptional regulator [Amycolatopsis taiwanensis]
MRSTTIDGRKVQQAREFAGLTQEGLGKKIGVDRSTVSFWESGTKSPRGANFRALCKVLKVKPSDLVASNDQAA